MKKSILYLTIFFLVGCHSAFITKFDDVEYPPAKEIQIFVDASLLNHGYFEIGQVEAKGGITVSKQQLLNDMKTEAMRAGAQALIKVEFYDSQYYEKHLATFDKPRAKAIMIRFK